MQSKVQGHAPQPLKPSKVGQILAGYATLLEKSRTTIFGFFSSIRIEWPL
jgi:hypothetical protein